MLDRRGALCAALTAALLLAIGNTILSPPRPRLVWNASESAPVGLWYVAPDASLRRGDMVAARLAAPWRGLAARRHYLPSNVPLIKRIAASGGDRICAAGGAVSINGIFVAARSRVDGEGRPIPGWHGCHTLGADEFLLLTAADSSFDGRYFGATARRDIIGKATPLWLR